MKEFQKEMRAAAEKAQQHQNDADFSCGVCLFAEPVGEIAEYTCTAQTADNNHQWVEQRQSAKVDIAYVVAVNGDEDAAEERRDESHAEGGLSFYKVFYVCHLYRLSVEHGFHQLVAHIAQLQGEEGLVCIQQAEENLVPLPDGQR